MAFHKDEVAGSIHGPAQWEYADAAARTGATGFAATDVGKVARQTDENSFWLLTATTPTWKEVLTAGNTTIGDVSTLAAGQVWIGSSAGAASANAISGNVSMTSAGVTSVTAVTIASMATGDFIYLNSGGALARLAHGASGQAVVSSGTTGYAFAPMAAGAGTSRSLAYTLNGAAYSADAIVWIRAPYAMTLAQMRLGQTVPSSGSGSTAASVIYHDTVPTVASAVTIFSSGGATTMGAGSYTAVSSALDVTNIAAGGWFGLGFATVNNANPGSNSTFELLT